MGPNFYLKRIEAETDMGSKQCKNVQFLISSKKNLGSVGFLESAHFIVWNKLIFRMLESQHYLAREIANSFKSFYHTP